jgi:hypothetical protein
MASPHNTLLKEPYLSSQPHQASFLPQAPFCPVLLNPTALYSFLPLVAPCPLFCGIKILLSFFLKRQPLERKEGRKTTFLSTSLKKVEGNYTAKKRRERNYF